MTMSTMSISTISISTMSISTVSMSTMATIVQWTLSTMSMSIRLRLRLMTLMVEVEVSLTDSVKVSLVELGYPLNSWEHTRLQTGWVLDGLDRITEPQPH